ELPETATVSPEEAHMVRLFLIRTLLAPYVRNFQSFSPAELSQQIERCEEALQDYNLRKNSKPNSTSASAADEIVRIFGRNSPLTNNARPQEPYITPQRE